MMKRMKLTALLLSAVLFLSSCGIVIINSGKEEETEVTTDVVSTDPYQPPNYPVVSETDGQQVAVDRLSELPDYDFEGRSVYFAVAEEIGNIFNDESGRYVDAVVARNQMITDKYNAVPIFAYQNADLLLTAIETADKSGEYYADFAVLRNGDLGVCYAEGVLRNLRSVAHLDLTAPYYDAAAMEQLTIGNVVYGAVGDATESIETYGCLYYNRTLGEAIGLPLDYDAVREGTFTWDSLYATLKMVPEGTAALASSLEVAVSARFAFAATGQTFLSVDGYQGLTASFVNDGTEQLVTLLKALLPLQVDALPAAEGGTETLHGFDIFRQGKALCAFGTVADMKRLTNAGFLWEILPLPKQNEEDPYATAVSSDAPVITVLSTSRDIETIGYILQALNAASYGYVTHAYYEDAMKNVISSAYTLDMLDLIRENPVYDFAVMFGGSSKALREGTYEALWVAVNGDSSLDDCVSRKSAALQRYLDSL